MLRGKKIKASFSSDAVPVFLSEEDRRGWPPWGPLLPAPSQAWLSFGLPGVRGKAALPAPGLGAKTQPGTGRCSTGVANGGYSQMH